MTIREVSAEPSRTSAPPADPYAVRRGELGQAVRLGFVEFLTGALLAAGGVLLLGALVFVADRTHLGAHSWLHQRLGRVFSDAGSVGQLLQSIATTVVTVASITFSLLLVAIQQSASSFTAQAFDQFLRRRLNQAYMGFFVGLGAYAILEAASVHQGFVPVYGAALTVLLTVVAVGLLLLLVYNTINQMRPVVIVESIHDHVVVARARQVQRVLRRTHAAPTLADGVRVPVPSVRTAFVIGYDLDVIQRAIDAAGARCEVVLEASIGRFLTYGDLMATIHSDRAADVASVVAAVRRGTRLAQRRNIDDVDAAFGLEQLATVGWTSISGAKQNPHAAGLVVGQLRDIVARFARTDPEAERAPDTAIVYPDDVPDVVVESVESLAVVTANSQQHQVAAAIIDTIATALELEHEPYRQRFTDVLVRTLPALLSHPPTRALDAATQRILDALRDIGDDGAADAVASALEHLRRRIGVVPEEYTPR